MYILGQGDRFGLSTRGGGATAGPSAHSKGSADAHVRVGPFDCSREARAGPFAHHNGGTDAGYRDASFTSGGDSLGGPFMDVNNDEDVQANSTTRNGALFSTNLERRYIGNNVLANTHAPQTVRICLTLGLNNIKILSTLLERYLWISKEKI